MSIILHVIHLDLMIHTMIYNSASPSTALVIPTQLTNINSRTACIIHPLMVVMTDSRLSDQCMDHIEATRPPPQPIDHHHQQL